MRNRAQRERNRSIPDGMRKMRITVNDLTLRTGALPGEPAVPKTTTTTHNYIPVSEEISEKENSKLQ